MAPVVLKSYTDSFFIFSNAFSNICGVILVHSSPIWSRNSTQAIMLSGILETGLIRELLLKFALTGLRTLQPFVVFKNLILKIRFNNENIYVLQCKLLLMQLFSKICRKFNLNHKWQCKITIFYVYKRIN